MSALYFDLEDFLFNVANDYVIDNYDEGVDDMSYQSSSNSSPPLSNSDLSFDMDFPSGNEIRGKKRGHEVEFEEKLHRDNIRIELIASRDHFLKIEKESSIPTKTGTEHIIYFEPFLNYDLVIKEIPFKIGNVENWFEIHIKPEDWARAFVQGDLFTTTKYLMHAILHHPDLPKAIIMEQTAYSSLVEIIKRAAVWMMSKFEAESRINLWSFGETFPEIVSPKFPPPSERDGETISKIIQDNDPRRMFLSELAKSMDHITSPATGPVITPDQKDTLSESGDADAANREKEKFDTIFKRVVDSVKSCLNIAGGRMKTAHVVGPLTKRTISRNTDRFVDSVQFSEDRWKAAFKEGKISLIAVARKLVGTMIRLDFDGREDDFTSIDSLNPVKLAAVLCAAKFLYVRRNDKNGWKEKFDSRIVQHCVFPTKEEFDAIKEEIWVHGKCTVLGRQLEKCGKNSNRSKILQKTSSEIKPCNCSAMTNILPNSDQIPTTGCIMYLPGNAVPISLVEVSMLTYKLVPFNKEILRGGDLSGIEPELLKEDCSESTMIILTVLDRLKEPEKPETRRHAFTQKTWNAAGETYKGKGVINAGTDLLTKLFEEEELKICTPGGRFNPKIKSARNKLNDDRQTQLFDALWYLVDNVTTPICTKPLYRGPWSLALKQLLKIDVFHYGTKKFRGIERRPKGSKVK